MTRVAIGEDLMPLQDGAIRVLDAHGCVVAAGDGPRLSNRPRPVCHSVSMEIELRDAVVALRDELLDAAATASDEPVEFVVGPVELEFGVELRRDAKGKAGFKAWVVSADVEGSVTSGRTHKVKVTLAPRRTGGGDLLVAGERVRPECPGGVPTDSER